MSLAESQDVGVVDTLKAFDPENDQVEFALIKSSDNFILASSGELILLEPLDFETNDHFTLEATVSDGEFVEQIDLLVNILNVNEPPPTHFL